MEYPASDVVGLTTSSEEKSKLLTSTKLNALQSSGIMPLRELNLA